MDCPFKNLVLLAFQLKKQNQSEKFPFKKKTVFILENRKPDLNFRIKRTECEIYYLCFFAKRTPESSFKRLRGVVVLQGCNSGSW